MRVVRGEVTAATGFARMFTLLLVALLAASAVAEAAEELQLDQVLWGSLASSDDSLQLVLYLPISEVSNQSSPLTVTAYAVNQYATTPLASRWPEVYLSEQPGPGPASPNATVSTKSPEQSQVVPASNANYAEPTDGPLPDVPYYRLYIGVWCPELAQGDTCDFTVSASVIVDLMGMRWATDAESGVFVLEGSLRSGLRHYFAAEALPSSQIMIEVCGAEDMSGNGNAIPMAFLFDRFTDVDQSSTDAGQWPTLSCQATYNSASVVEDPDTGADGYLQVCPLYVHFTETVSPATFALDISYWWNYSPVIDGTVNYYISVQTEKQVTMPAAMVEGYSNAQVAGFEMRQVGSDLVVDFVPLTASDAEGGVEELDRMTYCIFSDKVYDEVSREELEFSHLMNSGCYLVNTVDLQVSAWNYATSLNDSATVAGHKSMTATGFFDGLTKPDSMPYHVNIAASSPDYGDFAYSMQVLSNTDDLEAPSGGLGGWAIFGIVVGSLSVVAVAVGLVGFIGFVLYKKKNSSYEVMD